MTLWICIYSDMQISMHFYIKREGVHFLMSLGCQKHDIWDPRRVLQALAQQRPLLHVAHVFYWRSRFSLSKVFAEFTWGHHIAYYIFWNSYSTWLWVHQQGMIQCKHDHIISSYHVISFSEHLCVLYIILGNGEREKDYRHWSFELGLV